MIHPDIELCGIGCFVASDRPCSLLLAAHEAPPSLAAAVLFRRLSEEIGGVLTWEDPNSYGIELDHAIPVVRRLVVAERVRATMGSDASAASARRMFEHVTLGLEWDECPSKRWCVVSEQASWHARDRYDAALEAAKAWLVAHVATWERGEE